MSVKSQLKYKDEYCTEFVLKQIETVKKYFGINGSKRVYALDRWCRREYFLCEDKIYVICFDYTGEKYPYIPIIESAYVITFNDKEIINFNTVIPDDTTPKIRTGKSEIYGTFKIDETKKIYTKEDFLIWLDSPCETTDIVSVTYRKVIKFLQNYKKDTFNQGRYLFYAKRDNDLTWLYFVYAYDTKTKTELKIYVDSCFDTKFPEKLNQIYVQDLSGKLSPYQILQCKKAFLKYCTQECRELKAPNFYAMEFVKQCIQPIEIHKGWAVNIPFSNPNCEFTRNIWIDDDLKYDGKPYFVMTEGKDEWLSTRACAIDFFKPQYKSKEPYISGCFKRNHWNLDKETLEKLVNFLKSPYDNQKIAHTNWQRLIMAYNENFYGRDELPMDLPMPDYTKLLKE